LRARGLYALTLAVLAWAVYARRGRRRLDGCTVLITGGSRGLGLELARVFAKKGCRIALCARDVAKLDRATAELQGMGIDARAIVCDIRDRDQVAAAVQNIETAFGPIDVLVNNAGVMTVGPYNVMTSEDFAEAIDTHVWGPVHMIEAVLPGMRRSGGGRIVNIASIGGKLSVPHLLPYSVSKFALVGLSDGLRAELANDGIAVTTVSPGLMRTGSPRNVRVKGKHRAEYAWFAVSDALPGLSMSARRAAWRIVSACEIGEREVVLGLPARVATRVHALAPNLTGAVLELVARALPKAPLDGKRARRGFESESSVAPSALTALSDAAARRNNEETTTAKTR
jgi:short-subunit dehydrogenase